jgi:hypothetical protein
MRPGIYTSIPAEMYHADPCGEPSLNYTTAKSLILDSPWHAYQQHPLLGGKERVVKKVMDRGNIVHALLLGQPLDNLEIIDAPDYRKKSVRKQRDDARAAGRYVILRRELDELTEGLPLIRANLQEAEVDISGPCESTAIWDSEGVRCRTRFDNTSVDLTRIVDLKCTDDANPKNLARHIDDMCYDLQAAIEIDAIETLHPELVGRVSFCDVFIEMEYPYFVVRADHSESMLEVGRSKWRRAKTLWNECKSSGKWPGYRNHVTVQATNWAYSREFGEAS